MDFRPETHNNWQAIVPPGNSTSFAVWVNRLANGQNNVSIVVLVDYTSEETAALTSGLKWEEPCLAELVAKLGFFRSAARIQRPTFRQFVNPGLLIDGFTDQYATYFENTFADKYGPKIRNSLAPILQSHRAFVHSERTESRDAYFGVNSTARVIR